MKNSYFYSYQGYFEGVLVHAGSGIVILDSNSPSIYNDTVSCCEEMAKDSGATIDNIHLIALNEV